MSNTTIQLKKSGQTGNTPADLNYGEVAINYADGKLFYKNGVGIKAIENQKTFSTINANNSLIIATTPTDILSLVAGSNLLIDTNTITKTVTFSVPGGSSIDTVARDLAAAAFDGANTKTFTFYQNTAPPIANSHDLWVNSDTGVVYENFGTPSTPVWAEFGPTGVATNTAPGIISSTQLFVNYTPATTVNSAIMITAANTQGGSVYADFLKITNSSGGATNPNKTFRLNSTGGIEIINSAYNAQIMSVSDAGAMSVASAYQIAGKKAVNGPAFSAYANATLQTITSGSQQKVLFQTEEFDTDGCFASSRFTPTVEGYYQLNAEVRLDGASGTGEMMIILYKNGAEYKRGTNQQGTQIAANFWAMQVSSVVYANGTSDYFEIYVQQGSGGSVTVTAVNDPAITWFNGCMLRGA